MIIICVEYLLFFIKIKSTKKNIYSEWLNTSSKIVKRKQKLFTNKNKYIKIHIILEHLTKMKYISVGRKYNNNDIIP